MSCWFSKNIGYISGFTLKKLIHYDIFHSNYEVPVLMELHINKSTSQKSIHYSCTCDLKEMLYIQITLNI